jgi:hypothetical protein
MFSKRLTVGLFVLAVLTITIAGCRGKQHAHVLTSEDKDMVGSHTAGAETWKPLVQQATAQLMAQSAGTIHQTSHTTSPDGIPQRSICFLGVQNLSGEELGDAAEQIHEDITTMISQDPQFRVISRTYVEAAMDECRLTPQQLLLPEPQRQLLQTMERVQQPFDYLLFARVTSMSTNSNGDYQRDYKLTLEMIDIQSAQSFQTSADLRKGYHKSFLGKLKHYND